MNCKNCGKPLAPDVKFCGFCGTPTEEQPDDKKFKEKKKSTLNNTTKIALLMMVLAFCILGVAVFVFVSGNKETPLKTNENTQTTVSSQSATANSQVTYNSDIGEAVQVNDTTKAETLVNGNTATEEIYTEPQNNHNEVIINYDKYAKYIGKNIEFALSDYPNAEESILDNADSQLDIEDNVSLVYNYDINNELICNNFFCDIRSIYPNIPSNGSYVTMDDLENHLGISAERVETGSRRTTIFYNHYGYKVYIYCEEDYSIPIDKPFVYVGIQD